MRKVVVFVGGGASSLVNCILLKKEMPSFDVIIVEKDKKLGKKLSATGGGKSNIAPLKDNPYVYNPNSINMVESLYKEYPLDVYLDLLSSIGLESKTIKDYGYYPIHESAPQVVKNLYHQINKLGIKVIYDEFVDYQIKDKHIIINLIDNTIEADYMVLATGGLNENIKHILENHNIKTSKIRAGLCPIKVKEDVSTLFGCRFEGIVSLLYKNNIIKQYYGEIQFKKDGLSGIPVLNLSSEISRRDNLKDNDYQISIGLSNDYKPNLIGKSVEEALYMIFKEEYADYLINKHGFNKKDIIDVDKETKLYKVIHNEKFTVKSLYDISSSQVTVGGVILDEINQNFALKNNKNIYVIGELVDVDGICGGYNLRFAITSGIKAISNIINKC